MFGEVLQRSISLQFAQKQIRVRMLSQSV